MNLLDCIGVGVVAGTKQTNTDEILVYLPGFFPGAEGRTRAAVVETETIGYNSAGEEVRSQTLRSNVVGATWKRTGDSNRLTSPDVREGTKVALYNVKGQNNYFWTLEGVNQETFRLESVIYGWSANPNVDENTPFSVDDYYMMKVDTRTGLVSLRTSMANGEKTRFDIQVDAAEGVISLVGNEESYLKFDDVNRSFSYSNRDGSYLEIDKKVMTAYLPQQLNLFADVDINIKTKTLNLQSEEMNVDVGLTRWKGRIERTGDTEQTGDIKRTGTSHTTGLVSTDTDFKSPTITQETHVHGNVQNGRDVTNKGQ